MGRRLGSKNKPKEEATIAPEKPKQQKTPNKPGFIHGPCGQFWPTELVSCPTCN